MKRIVRYLVYSLIPLIVILSVTEISLRLIGFKYSDTVIQFRSLPEEIADSPNAKTKRTLSGVVYLGAIKDKYQFWVPKTSFVDHVPVEKPDGVVRIASMGCSCTQACVSTTDTYPELIAKYLNESSHSKKYESLNAGVGSYSSFQGLQRLKHVVLKYHPDILTIYFGWNDHWLAKVPDNQIRLKSTFEICLINFAEQFRTYQAYHKLISKIKEAFYPKEQKLLQFRVSLNDYGKNLKEMVDIARKNNMKVVLITAPYNLINFTPSWVFPLPKEDLIPVHEKYNDMVRKVAAENSVFLVDLEQIFKKEDMSKLLVDGIHFSPNGCKYAAKIIADEMRRASLAGG